MASTSYLNGLFFILALPCFSSVRCKSDQSPVEVVASAMACFDYHYVSCRESHRLDARGSINVNSRYTTEEYCRGPCLLETKLVLDCVNNRLQSFRFYNGATIQNMQYVLDTGCSNTSKRGNFNFVDYLDNFPDAYGDYPGGYDYYPGGNAYDVFCDGGNELAVVVNVAFDLLILLTCYFFQI